MAGVGYTHVAIAAVDRRRRLSAGYAFNSLTITDTGSARGLPVEVGNSPALRAGVSTWFDLTERTAVNVSVGYLFTGLRLTVLDGRPAGRTRRQRQHGPGPRRHRLSLVLNEAPCDCSFWSARPHRSSDACIIESVRPPYESRETLRQLFELGCRSVPLIAASGFAVGVVLSMHTRASLARFGAEALIPGGARHRPRARDRPADGGPAAVGADRRRHRRRARRDEGHRADRRARGQRPSTRSNTSSSRACVACVIALPMLTSLMNFTGMLGGFAAETAMTGMPLGTYFSAGVLVDPVLGPDPGHAQDRGVRLHHRHRLVLPRRQHDSRHRRRRPRVDAAASSTRRSC